MSGSTDARAQGIGKLSAAEQKQLGIPPDTKFYSASPFGTMNQEDARTALADNELFWIENFLLIGKSKLRTVWDQGAPLYTAAGSLKIVYFYWYNINGNVSCAVFLSDGTAVSVAYPSGTVTTISATVGTFYAGGQLPVARQYGDLFLLIGNNITSNDYWIWDGNLLYSAGTVGPYDNRDDITSPGSGYTSAPTVTVYGGSGTGVTATATVINGSVVAITVTNPGSGFTPSDAQVQVAFSGGGSDNGAILTAVLATGNIDHLELISGGSGYATAPTVTATGGGGTGFAATATITNGIVSAINITNHGSNYTSTPTIGFTGGGGIGASAVAVLSSGSVIGLTIVNPGSGFTGTPTLTFVGGGGVGANGTVSLANGQITSATMVNGGGGYTSPPAVVIESGLNNAASAVLDVMPFGVSGTSIETFQNRVWISNPAQVGPLSNGGVFNVSAPSTTTNFATSAGGLLFTSNDSWLRQEYVGLHQSNGYLYTLGDSSVSVVSNVQTSGNNPPSTTLNYLNTSAQIGAAWRDTIQDYGQSILFGNSNGVQGLYGGNVQRISKKIQDLFANAAFPPAAGAVTPSSAVANIYTIPVYLMNMTLVDPTTKTTRTVMIAWNESAWFIVSQASTMTFIGTQEISSKMSAWGTDGKSLYPLLASPSAELQKKLATKFWAAERPFIIHQPLVPYIRATDESAGQAGIALTLNMESAGLAQQIGGVGPTELPSYNVANITQPNFLAPRGELPVWAGAATAVAGAGLGMTITTRSPDLTLEDITVAYRQVGPLFG